MAAPAPRKPIETDSDRLRNVAKYSGLGFQMLGIIGICTYAGIKLDQYFQTKNPWFTIALMLLGVVGAMYQVIRAVTRD